MLRSLFSGISGLRTNQTMLDVTGNNIANANTTGFKGTTTVFQESLSQQLTGAGQPAGARGGTNPLQIGLGTGVSATSGNFTQGSAQQTGRPTDIMLQGDGFFVVENDGQPVYTRAGAFSFDANSNLVTPSGGFVLDSAGARITLPPGLASFNFGADGVLRGIQGDGTRVDIATLGVATFANPGGLERIGETSFRATANSGAAQVAQAGTDGRGTLLGGALEMSNVDLAAEFTTLILAQRGFQASSRVITTSDQVLEELVNIKR